MVVLSLGEGAHGFTLDAARGEFVLTHPRLRVPARGQIYSVNDARYFDWPLGLQRRAARPVLASALAEQVTLSHEVCFITTKMFTGLRLLGTTASSSSDP